MGERSRVRAVVAAMIALAAIGLVLEWRSPTRDTSTSAAPRIPSSAGGDDRAQAADDNRTIASIEGIVRGPGGRPVAGAWVTLRDETTPTDRPAASVESEADGTFAFDSIAAGKFRLAATARGLRAANGDVLVVARGATLRGIELQLGVGGVTLTGHVFDSGGGPISHATVTALDSGLIETATDASGAYTLTLEPRTYSIIARATRYAEHSKLVTLTADATVDFLLHPGATVRGHVMRAGSPVAGASVHLGEDDAWLSSPTDVTTGEDGAFEFPGLDPGRYDVLARAGADVASSLGLAVDVAGDVDTTLVLGPGAALTGTVQDGAGRPIDGAQVEVRQSWRGATWKSASDAHGSYRITGLVSGTLDVSVEAKDFVALRSEVEIGLGTTQHDYRLERGASVEGTLMGLDGRPAIDVDIAAKGRDHYWAFNDAKTDAAGHFTISGLEADEYALSTRMRDGFARADVTVAAGKHERVSMKLEKGAEIRGKVTLSGGAPAVGATVIANGRRYSRAEGTVGPDGTYAIKNVESGDFTVGATGASLHRRTWSATAAASEKKQVSLVAGEIKSQIDFVVPNALSPIRGVVVQADGSPAQRVAVASGEDDCSYGRKLPGESAETDSDGAFMVEAPTSKTDVCVFPPGQPTRTVRGVAAGTSDLRVVLERGTTIGGVVVRSDGQPVGYCAVQATAGEGSRDSAKASTDPNGAFELRGLASGTYSLRARTQDGFVGALRGIAVGPSEVRGLRVTLAAGASLRGRVIDESGAGMSEARVDVGMASTVTNMDGSFVLRGLPAGRASLTAHPAQMMFDMRDVALREATELDMGVLRIVERTIDGPRGLVGLNPQRVDEHLIVTRVYPGYPAANAGIHVGDEIIAIDSFAASELGDISALAVIRGVPGTSVTLRIATSDGAQRAYTLTRTAQLDGK